MSWHTRVWRALGWWSQPVGSEAAAGVLAFEQALQPSSARASACAASYDII